MSDTAFDPIAFLVDAVNIPSHETVEPMRDFLMETLETAGVGPAVDEAGNVLASRGSGTPHVVLNTHLDTVPPPVPFERDGDVIRGRGACDAKGPLTAFLASFLKAEVTGEVTLAVTPDEETDSTGAAALDLDADAYIVGEPTGLDVCPAAKGRFVAEITIEGSSGHAAEADAGVNAIRGAKPILDAIDTFDAAAGPGSHDLLGAPLLTPTVIDGGGPTNQIPATCTITVDRRSVPPETATGFLTALTTHLQAAAPPDVTVVVALAERQTPFLEAFATDPDAPVVQTLTDASGGTIRPFTAATEASYFAPRGPTVVFGPGELADDDGGIAHADREYVRVRDIHDAISALTQTLETRPTP